MKRNSSKYQQLLEDSDHLMDGLNILSSGLLLQTIILPGKFAESIYNGKKEFD